MKPMNNFDKLHTLKKSDIIDYLSFYNESDELINGVCSVSICSDGQLGSLTTVDSDGNTVIYEPGSYTYTRESIFVLGIGYLIPGDIVRLSISDSICYEVGYGWHTNTSNQTIHSWYLIPIDLDKVSHEISYKTDSNILTLYKEYLNTIEVVEFRKNRSSFYIGGEPNG